MNSRKKILVIAPEVPAPDRSSGELRFYTILKILSEQYRIVFVALNHRNDQRDGRYRLDLEALGLEVYIQACSFKKIFLAQKFLAVFIEFYFTAEHCLSNIRILDPQCPVIVDSVDIHYYREGLKYGLTKAQADLTKSIETKKRELTVYQQADLVIAVTQEDADVVRAEDSMIVFDIIPNIHPIVESKDEERDRNLLIFIGGFKHQPNEDAVRYFCKEVFPFVLEKRPQMKFHIIGAGVSEDLKKSVNGNVQFLGFVPSVTPYLHKSYISIAPLRFGAGMKGKIGEAMAHGLPVVTTSIGIQGLALRHREHVMVGDSPKEFADSILALTADEQLYNKVSANGLNYIKANFTPEMIREEIFRIFENVQLRPVKKLSMLERGKFFIRYISQIF